MLSAGLTVLRFTEGLHNQTPVEYVDGGVPVPVHGRSAASAAERPLRPRPVTFWRHVEYTSDLIPGSEAEICVITLFRSNLESFPPPVTNTLVT